MYDSIYCNGTLGVLIYWEKYSFGIKKDVEKKNVKEKKNL